MPSSVVHSSQTNPLEAPARVGSRRFALYGWGVLAYCLLMIAWGVFVRASGAGDGCGANWPKCDGELMPLFSGNWEKTVEASHRATTGIFMPLVIALWVWSVRLFPKQGAHPARRAAWWALLLTVVEALIGAVLVKFGWVDKNTSTGRVVLGIAHLVNTFGLITALCLAAWWGGGAARLQTRAQGPLAGALWGALGGALLLGVTGAISALGDTIYPARSLGEGFQQDFNPTSHYLLQLRVWHPWLAATLSLYVILVAGVVTKLRPAPQVILWARIMAGVFVAQMLVGLLNLLMLAPIAMQMLHLFLADLTWLSILMLVVAALSEGVPHAEIAQDEGLAALLAGYEIETTGRATWKDYLLMTKPRVISLLLLTTVAAMFIAEGGFPNGWLILATSLGFYMAAGAANAINMVLERDLDVKMKRTASRPTVTQKVSSRHALRFAFALAFGSFVMLNVFASTMAALMALSGLVFYVVVYTILLKRRTWSNIVIGGAAGAFPPLVGWAAVTGDLSNLALVMFALIFVWTPVHFWALALLIKEDYAEAGVPMLPCVHGDRATIIQIAAYAVLTVVVSLVPFFLRDAEGVPWAGRFYMGAVLLLNAALAWFSVRLWKAPEKPQASALFHYSMLYLGLLFVSLAVEKAGIMAAIVPIAALAICFELEKLCRSEAKMAAETVGKAAAG
ncbi:MAG TPA: heme o synthase [Abditibacteriaceae bacterium]|jgi:protoheme IX farnesyltransferase